MTRKGSGVRAPHGPPLGTAIGGLVCPRGADRAQVLVSRPPAAGPMVGWVLWSAAAVCEWCAASAPLTVAS